jgi:hypothetical protein
VNNKRHSTKQKPSQTAAHHKEAPVKPAFITRRRVLALGAVAIAGGGLTVLLNPTSTMAEEVIVYKDPSCECCGRWVRHMRRNGFKVSVSNVDDMEPIKRRAEIPEAMESCHTAFIGGYSVEGHVPASDIKRILAARPSIKGLAVPGMPSSAPGMDSPDKEPFMVMAFNSQGKTSVFASY